MDEHLVAGALLPRLRRWLHGDEHSRRADNGLLGEVKPHSLQDLTRVCRPCLELDMASIRRLDKVRHNALQCTLVADDSLDDIRRLGMRRDSVEA